MPPRPAGNPKRAAAPTAACQFCQKTFSTRGLGTHEKSCRSRMEALRNDAEALPDAIHRLLETTGQQASSAAEATATRALVESLMPSITPPIIKKTRSAGPSVHLDESARFDFDNDDNFTPSPITSDPPADTEERVYQIDDIKTQYHPHSQRPEKIENFSDYCQYTASSTSPRPNPEPWAPFRSRFDFEVAEFALRAALNEDQTNVLISLFKRCSVSESLTISSYAELKRFWDGASEKLTGFTRTSIDVQLTNSETRAYDVWTRSLWDWGLDVVGDPELGPRCHWDAERVYKHDGKEFVRLFNEPWTSNRWWNVQTELPPEGKPLCFILYADKTRLSSFGTEKGYPVIARIGNLPVDIRNGEGVGGGRIVGWLPIVEEDADESGKRRFVKHKRAIWHQAIYVLLELVAKFSKRGYYFECGDFIKRWLYPIILILSADFEEQSMMSLTRGVGADFPCPVCLIPGDELLELEKIYSLRTTESMQAALKEAQELSTLQERNKFLQQYGLRDVENVFWNISHTCVYKALSFDRLHFNHGGLFSDHLFEEFKRVVAALGRSSIVTVDQQIQEIPRWRNLNHFNSVMTTSFSDGSKYEDISKIILFAAHNVLTPETSRSGYLLLQCIRSYLELDMFASLHVHTEHTIAEGQAELERFGKLLKEYSQHSPDKIWDLVKVHYLQHLFDDIKEKGATRNYNTKVNEKCHGPLKTSYKLRTNFKEVAGQILKIDHWCYVSAYIRDRLDELDEYESKSTAAEPEPAVPSSSRYNVHVYVGSRQSPCSFNELEGAHSENLAFHQFRKNLRTFFTAHFQRQVSISGNEMITPYQYLLVNYESKIDWKMETDYLRCSPLFRGAPRYDHVVVDNGEGRFFFAKLLFVFACTVQATEFIMALIHPLDAPTTNLHRARDRDLRLHRLRAQPRAACRFISVESIIRGALIMKDYGTEGDYLVVESIDADLWTRIRELRQGTA